MKLINADKLKADIRFRCSECALNGSKHCKEQCTINNICEVIDLQPAVPNVTVFCENASWEEIQLFKKELEEVLNNDKK